MSSGERQHGERNRLLLALSGPEYARLLPSLEISPVPAGRVLYQASERITTVYFPQRSVLSMLVADDDGAWVEVQTVGNEGVVGLSAYFAGGTAHARTVARVPDHATTMGAAAFRRALRASKPFRDLVLRYTQTVLDELSRATLCHRLHRLEARCAHCLLTTQDRVGSDRFLLTQASLAQMVGVRRPSVASAAADLRDARLIRYSRGRIAIVDRPGLEAVACSCYGILRANYEASVGRARRSTR